MADLYYHTAITTLIIAALIAFAGWIYFNFFDNYKNQEK